MTHQSGTSEIDEAAWASLYSTVSRPFDVPEESKIAVKVINHYRDEVLKVCDTKNGSNGHQGSITKRKDGLYMARYWVETPAGKKRKTIYGKKGEKRQDLADRLAEALGDRSRGLVFEGMSGRSRISRTAGSQARSKAP